MSKERMTEHGYPAEPRKLEENIWFYEEHKGLRMVVSPPYEKATVFLVPWRKVEAAMKTRTAAIKRLRKPHKPSRKATTP